MIGKYQCFMYVPLGWPPQTVNKIVIALPGSGAQFKGEMISKSVFLLLWEITFTFKNNNK